MITHFGASPSEIPPLLRAVLLENPESMSASPMFTAALAYARSGFPILPCLEDTKKPHATTVFPNGAKSATVDVESTRDHWFKNPNDNIGVASDGSFVLVDIDPRNGGSLEAAERIGLPMDGYREVTVSGGRRIPLIMPAGMVAVRSAQPVNGVEIKALGAYALAPHSRVGGRWYSPEPGRDIWRFGSIPAAWDMLGVLVAQISTLSSISVIPQDELSAAVLERQMRRSIDYSQGIIAILDGDCDWSRYFDTAQDLSESGRDFQLALAASHFLKQHPRRGNVLAALLIRHSSKSRRLDDHGFVFTGHTGRPLHVNSLDAQFRRLIVDAGVPRIRFHDLRHTSATLMLLIGEHPKIVQERLGHTDISMTLNRYSHVVPSMQRRAADNLSAALNGTKSAASQNVRGKTAAK